MMLTGKTVLVTGANAGIGKATAYAFAQLGATVIMVARDAMRGKTAQDEIITASKNENVHLLLADLSEQSSIRQLTSQIRDRVKQLDILINNAAVYRSERTLTSDGFEVMFATNHLGHFLLTNLLLDLLEASKSARIVNVTAPSTVKLNFDDLQGEKNFNSLSAFGASKMANLLFTFELSNRLKTSHITVNAIHPGLVRSGIMKDANIVIRLLTRLMSGSPEKAANAIVALSTSEAYAGKSGKFYKNGREITPAPYALNEVHQQQLWSISERLRRRPN